MKITDEQLKLVASSVARLVYRDLLKNGILERAADAAAREAGDKAGHAVRLTLEEWREFPA